MRFLRLEEINSTNTYVLEHFDELENGCVVTAKEQTSGRGRFQRKWMSGNYENVYATFVLKPQKQEHIANLTQYLCVTCAKVLADYGVQASIKWPNDILIEGKKIAGILCEMSSNNNVTKGVALGIGVNLNMPEHVVEKIEKPAVSLNLILGKEIDKELFLNKLVDRFFNDYQKFEDKGFSFIKENYMKNIDFLGKTIQIQQRDGGEKVQYIAKAIDKNGYLLVLDETGNEKTVYSGDLIL